MRKRKKKGKFDINPKCNGCLAVWKLLRTYIATEMKTSSIIRFKP